MKVNLISIGLNDKETVIGTVTWDGKEVKIETGSEGLKEDLEKGYRIGKKVYTPKDGEEFVKNLRIAYQGSRFRAHLVKEEGEGKEEPKA